MNKSVFIFLLALCNAGLFAQPNIQWQKSLGGTGEDGSAYSAPGRTIIRQTNDGGYITAGWTFSTDGDVSGNHGLSDYWIVKQDQTGAIQWKKTLGGQMDDRPADIIQTSDRGYIIAGSACSKDGNVTGHHGDTIHFDYWIVKLDSTGSIQWQKSLGGTKYDKACSVVQTDDGGYVIGGSSCSSDGDVTGHHSLGPASALNDVWIVKLDAAGNLLWQKSFGGDYDDVACSLEKTADHGFIIAAGSGSANGDVTGHHGPAGASNSGDAWIIKLDSAGTLQWQKSYGGTETDFAVHAIQTSDGGYLFGGSSLSIDGDVTGLHGYSSGYLGHYDYWIVKLSATGIIQWRKSLGGSLTDNFCSLEETPDGSFLLAGNTQSTDGDLTGLYSGTDYDEWIIKLSSSGSIIWQKLMGGIATEECDMIHLTTDGSYILSGASTSNSGDVSGHHGIAGTSSYAGTNDFWIVKLCNTPVPVITASAAVVCEGDSVVLTSSPAAAYLWNTGATTQSIRVTASGNYKVTGYNATGCSAISPAKNIFVIPDTVSHNYSHCDSLVLNGHVYTSSGIYYQYLTNVLGCDSTLKVNATVYRVNTTVTVYENYLISAGGSGATFKWLNCDAGYAVQWMSSSAPTWVPSVNGNYAVSVSTPAGCIDTSLCYAFSIQSTVWPGDANNDSVADNTDLLQVGLFYSQLGPPRAVTGNVWQGDTASNWNFPEINQSDIKHADCNGDGVINDNDTLAIVQNINMVHAITTYTPGGARIGAPYLYMVAPSGTFASGDSVDVEIWAGTSANPATGTYGVAFDIDYDPALVEAGTEKLFYQPGWLGTPGVNELKLAKIDNAAGIAYGAVTRTNHTNATGFGKIADFSFKLSNAIGTNAAMNLSFQDYQANDASGNDFPFNLAGSTLIINPVTLGVQTNTISTSFSVYPNPSTGQFTITLPDEENAVIIITDVLGREVITTKATAKTMSTALYKNGVYFISVKTTTGIQTKRIVISSAAN